MEGQTITDILIEAGEKVIVPERKENWISYVNSTKGNIDSLRKITVALGIIMVLDEGVDMDYVVDSFKNNGCPMDDITVRSLVANYSLRGPEFFEKTATEPIPIGNIDHLEKLKIENEKIKYIHKLKKDGYKVEYIPDGPIKVFAPEIKYDITLTRKKDE